MLKLNDISKRITGLSVEEINSLPLEKEVNQIEQKIGRSLAFKPSTNSSLSVMSRGNPLLALNRITTMQEVDQRLSQLIGNSYAKK